VFREDNFTGWLWNISRLKFTLLFQYKGRQFEKLQFQLTIMVKLLNKGYPKIQFVVAHNLFNTIANFLLENKGTSYLCRLKQLLQKRRY